VRARALRAVAWGAVCAGIALPLARRRLGLPPAAAAAAAIAAPFGLAVATERSPRRDVAVYVLQMWAYIILHELPNDDPRRLERRVLVEYPIEFDRRVLRAQPNAVLQRKLARPGDPRPLDYALTVAHWAWFVQPHATAAWILWKHPERFERTAVSICAVFDLGLMGYFAVPTAPPWWAAEKGHIESLHRIMEDVGKRVWRGLWPHLYDFLGGNPLAAMPSLHLATSVMAAHELADVGPLPGALGWAYAVLLGFALVYLGEHYVIDLLAGLALTEGVRAARPLAAPLLGDLGRRIAALEQTARAA
jgi:hypothetical protein